MYRIAVKTFFVLMLVLSLYSNAQSWQQKTDSLNLAAQQQWLDLIHYKQNRLTGQFQSYVDDTRFFLSAEGYKNPESELLATLYTLIEQPSSQCKFPARTQWLLQMLPELARQLTPVACKEYSLWREKLKAKYVVLVFAASYLNSPSSMYGHTFLRFDVEDIKQQSPLLSYALNFGANIPPDENGLVYAYRGLAGGYPGVFAGNAYYEKIKEYTRLENRDLWEYQLNLNDEELDRLLAHVWELKDINFDYYFFDENCSFRLLELLDVARPGLQLAKQFPAMAIPIDTVRAVQDAGLISELVYRPSNKVKLDYQIQMLSEPEQLLAKQLSADTGILLQDEFLNLDKRIQERVVRLAYAYLRYSENKQQREAAVAQRSLNLLRFINRNKQENQAAMVSQPKMPFKPEQGHETMLLSAAAGTEENKRIVDIEWRLSYHDLLDLSLGYPRGASLNMGRFVVRFKEDESAQLQRFDVIDIQSLSPRDNFFKPLSWRVNTGAERVWTNGKDELVAQVNAGGGISYPTVNDSMVYLLATARLEHNSQFEKSWNVAPGVAIGGLVQGKTASAKLAAEHYRFSNGDKRHRVQFAYDWHLTINHSIRLNFSRSFFEDRNINETTLAYRYFF